MNNKYKHVFSPIRIRGIDFKNRITLAPPSTNLSSPDGLVTHEFVDWFRMIARGGTSVLYVGNASIDIEECKDEPIQLNLKNPNSILPMSWYAEMAAAYGCHASMEINHNGKDTAFETVGHAPYSASAIITSSEISRAKRLGRDPIRSIEMTHEKIEETIEKYANAALNMKKSGMDIVLVHGGHGNLISQFMSPMYNKRTDEWGGSLENRMRFAIEICDRIRKRCGEEFVIEFRISADEIADEGMHFDETLEAIGMLKDYIDIIHVSAGIHSDFDMKYYRNWCQNYMMPHMFNVHYAKKVKERYPDLLVNTVGSIMSLDMAEEILSNGWADFVAMCRALMADPDMPRKYAEGRPEDRRPCLRCDLCAKRLHPAEKLGGSRPINCAVNPISMLTSELKDGLVPKAPVKKRVGIVGGGPAGMYALMSACDRGHDVTLFEKSDRLGGNIIGAAFSPHKRDMKDYLAWCERTVKKYPATLKLGVEATPELLEKENFDALIIAVGADPVIPPVKGADMPHVHWASDAQVKGLPVGKKVVIVGAGSIGTEAAIDYADEGRDVEIIEILDAEGANLNLRKGAATAAPELYEMLKERSVPIHLRTRLDEVRSGCIVVTDLETGKQREIAADTVLMATGMRSRWEVVDKLRGYAVATDTYVVGDALKVGNISTATNGGFQAALKI